MLPRLAIGVVAWTAFAALREMSLTLPSAAAGVLGSLANTAGVIGMAVLFGYLPPAAILPVVPQAVAEAVLAALVTVAVVWGVELARGGRTTASAWAGRKNLHPRIYLSVDATLPGPAVPSKC